VTHWSSKEDWEQFLALRQQYDLLVMGRKTYDAVLPTPEADRLRVVLTSHPDEYAAAVVPGQLEFSALRPKELIAALEARGYTSLLLLGGGKVNGAFLAAGLGDELYLTIEPVVFGNGVPLLSATDVTISLKLLESQQLNEQGTLLLHYAILHPTP
jgi:dihydrofolate reductase